MSAGRFGGLEVSRSTVMALLHAEAVERAEQREREAAAQARREQLDAQLQAYYMEHGEYPNQTLARQQAIVAQREQRELERRAQERREQLEDLRVSLMAQGRRWRTIDEVIAEMRGLPV